MAPGNALLIVEFAVVFVGVPALLATYQLPVPKILLLLAVAGACLVWLLRAPGFDRKVLWNTEGFHQGARDVLRLFAVTAPARRWGVGVRPGIVARASAALAGPLARGDAALPAPLGLSPGADLPRSSSTATGRSSRRKRCSPGRARSRSPGAYHLRERRGAAPLRMRRLPLRDDLSSLRLFAARLASACPLRLPHLHHRPGPAFLPWSRVLNAPGSVTLPATRLWPRHRGWRRRLSLRPSLPAGRLPAR